MLVYVCVMCVWTDWMCIEATPSSCFVGVVQSPSYSELNRLPSGGATLFSIRGASITGADRTHSDSQTDRQSVSQTDKSVCMAVPMVGVGVLRATRREGMDAPSLSVCLSACVCVCMCAGMYTQADGV